MLVYSYQKDKHNNNQQHHSILKLQIHKRNAQCNYDNNQQNCSEHHPRSLHVLQLSHCFIKMFSFLGSSVFFSMLLFLSILTLEVMTALILVSIWESNVALLFLINNQKRSGICSLILNGSLNKTDLSVIILLPDSLEAVRETMPALVAQKPF